MKKVIFSGLMVIVPLGITFYAIYFIYDSLNSISSWFPLPVFPGSGILYIFLLILLVGFVSQWWVAKKGIALIETIISKFPGIKTLYRMSKETLSSFSGENKAFSQVVLYKEQEDVFRIGFLTAKDVQQFELSQDYVSVYFPHGLQVSGDIRLLPKDKIVFVNTPVEDALQFCLSAGVASKKKNVEAL
jgi:uncharacterized membrane protein